MLFNQPFAMELHMFFVTVALVGAGLFLIWAKANLNKKQLLQLAVGLIALGVLGAWLIPSLLLKGDFSHNCPFFNNTGAIENSPEMENFKAQLGTY